MILKRLLGFINKGDGRSIKAKKNILFGFGVKGFGLILSFVRVPIILDYLDVDKYGVWLTISSIVLWVNYLDLGIGHGLRNNFAIALAEGDKLKARSYVSVAYYYLSGIFLLLSLVLLPLIWFLDWQSALNVDSIAGRELRNSVLVVFGFFVLRFIANLITSILKADQRPAMAEFLTPLGSALSLIFVYLLGFYSDNSLFLACMAISLPSTMVIVIANFYFFKKLYHQFLPRLKFARKEYFKVIFNLGVKFFLIQLGSLVMFSSSNFILIQLAGPEEVTNYNITRRYYSMPLMFFSMVLMPYWSAITEAFVKNEFDWIKNKMRQLNYLSIAFSGVVVLMFFLEGFAFNLWLGRNLDKSPNLSIALVVMNVLLILFSMYTSFINGTGRLKLSLYIVVVKMLLFVPLAYLFTSWLEGTGLVLTLIVVNAIPNAILEFSQYRRIINKRANGIWAR